MIKHLIPNLVACTALTLFTPAFAQEAEQEPGIVDQLNWQLGPGVGDLGGIAQIDIPEGYLFVDGDDTRVLMEAMQNPINGEEVGFLAPEAMDWFIVFEFSDVGYVADDEKGSLDSAAMLKSIQEATEEGNKERVRRGWATFTVLGWQQAPRYNEATHNLEWAIHGESGGEPVINWNTRLLGRGGVMSVTLVADPETLEGILPQFNERLAMFTYKDGHRYAEYKEGDKLAKYGLSALVVGGAAAVAVKSGALKWLWKVLVVGAVAVGGVFKKFFSGRKEQ